MAEVRNKRSWEYGPFLNWGTGVGNRSDYKFFWGGFELGKVLTPVVHAGIFSGQFELAGNIMPLWQAYTPPPHEQTYTCDHDERAVRTRCTLPFGGGTFHGVSLTPVIFRWNFLTRSRRIQPWFQGAGGLIYTTHKFPPNILSNSNPASGPIIDGGTSVWNFSPQGGGGIHYFIRPKRSIDIGRERSAHLLGLAGRPQPGRECQHSGAGGIYVLEMIKTGTRESGIENGIRERGSGSRAQRNSGNGKGAEQQ